MPVTARLSKLLYDRLGEQVVNELVDWFNQVDATYRVDLREMYEQNFARFEARLEQRLAELRGEMNVGFTQVKVTFEQALREQTRWFIAAWGALVAAWAAIVALLIAMWVRLP
jgi:hypothetical protein